MLAGFSPLCLMTDFRPFESTRTSAQVMFAGGMSTEMCSRLLCMLYESAVSEFCLIFMKRVE
jgi:hypothetical protein